MTMSSNPSKRTRKPKTQETPAQPQVETPEEEIKALDPDNPQEVEAWKRGWLRAIEKETSVDRICEKLRTTLAQYLRHRTADLKFDAECLFLDQIIDVKITNKVRDQAQEGESRAQGLYFKEVRRPAFDPGFASWNPPPPPSPESPMGSLPSAITNAMIKVALEELNKLKRPSDPVAPSQPPKPDAQE